MAQVHAEGGATRLSLLDGQGQVLMQSDGQSPDQPRRPDRPGRPGGARVSRGGKPRQRGRLHLDDLLDASHRTVSADPVPGDRPDALVAGDFNGDGRTDLAVANYGSNDVSVLLGNGDGTFQTQVTYAVGTDPSALVAGDFTGDGRTDLAVANLGSNDVSVLLGNGDGTFQTQVTYAVGSAPDALVAGDFTGDGRTDLAVANHGSNDVSVLLGNGDGTFQPR